MKLSVDKYVRPAGPPEDSTFVAATGVGARVLGLIDGVITAL